MAQTIVGEMEMHNVANLATLQTPLASFFPPKKAPKPYLVSENRQYSCARSCFPSTRTPLSLSLSAQFLFSTHTHLSLSLSLSASAQILFSVRQRRAELNSVKHRYYVACFSNFTCKYSQNHSTAIVIILWVFYLIKQRLDYKDFCAD